VLHGHARVAIGRMALLIRIFDDPVHSGGHLVGTALVDCRVDHAGRRYGCIVPLGHPERCSRPHGVWFRWKWQSGQGRANHSHHFGLPLCLFLGAQVYLLPLHTGQH